MSRSPTASPCCSRCADSGGCINADCQCHRLAAADAALTEIEASAHHPTLDVAVELLRTLAPPDEAEDTEWIIERARTLGLMRGLRLLGRVAHDMTFDLADQHPRARLLHRLRHVASFAARALEAAAARPTTSSPTPGEAR